MSTASGEMQHRINGLQGQDTAEISLVTLEAWVLQAVEQFKPDKGTLRVGSVGDNWNDAVELETQLHGGAKDALVKLRGRDVRQVVREYRKADSDFIAFLRLDGNPDAGSIGTMLVLRFMERKEVRVQDGSCGQLLELHFRVHQEGLDLHIASPSAVSARKLAQHSPVARDSECASGSDLSAIWGWNATVPTAVQRCVHDIIAERAWQHPNAPAVAAWDGELDYQQLDQLSSRLAHYLVDDSDYVVITSLSKYFSGYADVMAGSVILNPNSRHYDPLRKRMRATYENNLFVEDAIRLESNSRNFLPRMARINETTQYLVDQLSLLVHPASPLTRIFYPSVCSSRRFYERQMRPLLSPERRPGYGGVFTMEFGDIASASVFFDHLHVYKGLSFGADVCLAAPYVQMTGLDDQKQASTNGVKETIIRFSVGLEEAEEILQRINVAMDAANQVWMPKILEKSY
ncbi:hypothetical protein BDW59DRAFT_160920 [Aspergillus cavernicola]|uniref:Pyridoxal phosphate-dependent transferase n=1 Tax=Aspergillus cavernicola TaxID=176166 RepID=A0ABR4IGM8_9EURO